MFTTSGFTMALIVLAMLVLSVIGPVLSILFLVLWFTPNKSRNRTADKAMARYIKVAREEYARGEITEKEFEARKQAVV